ncbi:hypothetical protein SDC9_25421 [bioreactor metagenome]|uniref:Uncharacterized protein n=1 Tax=bioreactor metagenome TaxID=1076179 RepID=A0A644UKJ7_9ZZZZ
MQEISEGIEGYAAEVIGFLGRRDAERGLTGPGLEGVGGFDHVIEYVDREFAFCFADLHLLDKESKPLGGFHSEFGKRDHAHVYPGQIPVGSGDGVKERPEDLRLINFTPHK